MEFVLDTSATLPWFFQDEADEASDALLELLKDGSAVAPSIWIYEMANALHVAVRRGRIPEDGPALAFDALRGLGIEVAAYPSLVSLARTARIHELSAYDAAYLDLAEARGLPLATRDERLAEKARDAGVELLSA